MQRVWRGRQSAARGARRGNRFLRAGLGGWIAGLLCAAGTPLLAQAPGEAAAGAYHLYLVPETTDGIAFLTHMADVTLAQTPAFGTRYAAVAVYRLHNTRAEPQVLTVRVRSLAGPVAHPANGRLETVTLHRGPARLPLEAASGNQWQSSVALEADERIALELRYAVRGTGRYFPRVQYDVAPLRRWGPPPESLRISFYPNSEVDPRTLQAAQPPDVQFAAGEIRWHYENAWPSQAPHAQFIHQASWDGIREAERQDRPLALGQRYYDLYMAADAPAASRPLFYAQALAAWLRAAERHPGPAHYGLARLYRTRWLAAAPAAQAHYLELFLRHARRAQETLDPARAAARQDVARWLGEGLEARVARAVQREDWAGVNAALAEIERLPAAGMAPERIAGIRADARLQQALRLWAAGAADEALALAGHPLEEPDRAPAPEAWPLFASWIVEIEAEPQALALQLQGSLHPAQAARAAQKLEFLEPWAQRAGEDLTLAWHFRTLAEEPSRTVLHLNVRATDPVQARRLADSLAADADWILLQQLLQPPWGQNRTRRHPFAQDAHYVFALDLRPAFDLWRAKALALEQNAVQEASAGTNAPEDAIRQLHFLNAAAEWRRLARHTVAFVRLLPAAEAGAAPARGQWAATEDQPYVQAQVTQRVPRGPRVAWLAAGLAAFATAASWGLVRLRLGRGAAPPFETVP